MTNHFETSVCENDDKRFISDLEECLDEFEPQFEFYIQFYR